VIKINPPRITTVVVSILLLSSGATPLTAFAQTRVSDPSYGPAIELLTGLIMTEMEEKGLGALSIALVNEGGLIWSSVFGTARPETDTPVTSRTVYRVGSVSKLFTALAVMQLHEAGTVDIDAPVTEYLPDFLPKNPFGTPITLRHLVAHYSGLVREPPVGHYFDPTEPSLAETVASLSRTTLVYEPGSQVKYSNGAVSAAGYVVQKMTGRPFAKAMDQALFQPLNMESSSFEPLPHLTERMAEGVMWWVDGRESTAPTFHLGLVPAGTLYSTVDDLARFVEAVLNGGMGPAGRILSSEGLAEMLSPQVKKPTVSCYFDVGFGFNLQTCWEGTLRARHGGGIYGFSTELATLPEEGVGVVVAASRGAAGSVVRHIGEVALRALLAVRKGPPCPRWLRRRSPLPAFGRNWMISLRQPPECRPGLRLSTENSWGIMGGRTWE
jgi:CubicO group peptidase (beta-lactamase class C family)